MASGMDWISWPLVKIGLGAADALELGDDLLGGDAAAQGQRDQPADGLGVGHGRVAALADRGEDLERLLVEDR